MAFNFIVLNIYFRFFCAAVAAIATPSPVTEIHLTNIPMQAGPVIEKANTGAGIHCVRALTVQNCNNVYLNLNYCKFALHLKTLFYICAAFAFLFFTAKQLWRFFWFSLLLFLLSLLSSHTPREQMKYDERKKKNRGQQEKSLIKRNKLC